MSTCQNLCRMEISVCANLNLRAKVIGIHVTHVSSNVIGSWLFNSVLCLFIISVNVSRNVCYLLHHWYFSLFLRLLFVMECFHRVNTIILPYRRPRKMKIDVHPLTQNPTAAWQQIAQTQKVFKVKVRPPATPVAGNKARIVCMSDTHSLIPHLKFDVPDGDIFIHAGDFTKCGQLEEVDEFNKWLGK